MTPCHSPWQDALLSMSLARALGHHGVGCARWTLGSSGLPAEGDVTAIGTLLRLSGNGRAVPEPARDTGDVGMHISNYDVLKRAVQAEMGIAMLPAGVVIPPPPGTVVRALDALGRHSGWVRVWCRSLRRRW